MVDPMPIVTPVVRWLSRNFLDPCGAGPSAPPGAALAPLLDRFHRSPRAGRRRAIFRPCGLLFLEDALAPKCRDAPRSHSPNAQGRKRCQHGEAKRATNRTAPQ